MDCECVMEDAMQLDNKLDQAAIEVLKCYQIV